MEWLYWLNFLELNARFSHRNGLAQQASRNGAVLAGVRLGGGGGGVWTPGLWLSAIILFVVPAILAPWYVRWSRTKVSGV